MPSDPLPKDVQERLSQIRHVARFSAPSGCAIASYTSHHPLPSRPRVRRKDDRTENKGKRCVVSIVSTVAYLGLEARSVEVQCQIAPGMVGFAVVGLPDKAVAESRERVRAAISSLGLALPPKRITINLSPADLPKEGSHYDLPIALALLAAMAMSHVIASEAIQRGAIEPNWIISPQARRQQNGWHSCGGERVFRHGSGAGARLIKDWIRNQMQP